MLILRCRRQINYAKCATETIAAKVNLGWASDKSEFANYEQRAVHFENAVNFQKERVLFYCVWKANWPRIQWALAHWQITIIQILPHFLRFMPLLHGTKTAELAGIHFTIVGIYKSKFVQNRTLRTFFWKRLRWQQTCVYVQFREIETYK